MTNEKLVAHYWISIVDGFGYRTPGVCEIMPDHPSDPNFMPTHGDDYKFPHSCIIPDCENTVEFDDEPWCFEHSPDEGSSLPGYSARRAAAVHEKSNIVNIFDER